jgi:hypothetical protein
VPVLSDGKAMSDLKERERITTEAFLSEDRSFRWWLTRVWDQNLPLLAVIGVNPSTADERKDDPTIRKDMGFARRLGYGGVLKLNVGAFRSTDPELWRRAPDPIGPLNTAAHLRGYVDEFGVKRVVAAWGKNGNYAPDQCAAIRAAFPELWCWGRNGDGTPRHTLMLPYSTELEPYV